MSRTTHHKEQKHRHGGHDLWSRRPRAGHCYSAYNKLICRRIERKRKRKEILRELDEYENCT